MCLYGAILAKRSRFSVVLACVLGHFLSVLGKITYVKISAKDRPQMWKIRSDFNNEDVKKLVSPKARILIATPEII